MASPLHSSPSNEILNHHAYTSLRPHTIRSQIVKVDVDSDSLSNMTVEHTDVVYRAKDWSIGLKEENGYNVKSPQMRNSYTTNKRNYELIEKFNERNRNQYHIIRIKEQNRSAHIDSIQRIKNRDNKFVDSRININFEKYERPSRNEIISRKGERKLIRFVDGKRNIHTGMHYMHNKDSFNSQMVDIDHHGLIYDHRSHNRVRGQYRSRYGVTNSEARLCRDNNEDEALIDSRNVKTYDEYERCNVIQVTDRGERLAGSKSSPPTPTLYSIHKAVVNSIRPFGMFVQMEGYQDHGLVHISEVSNNEISTREDSEEAKVKALCTVANEGEMVWVKVISLKIEDFKTRIGCSMKYVNQKDGRDLDPNNTQLEQQSSQPATLQLKSESATVLEEDDADAMIQSHRKGKERMMPRELNSGHMQSSGIPRQLLATGSVGRGRAMVQPAWMKHGIGIGGPVAAASPVVEDEKQSSDVTERVTSTVEEGAAVIARLKEEKRRRKEERRRRRERRHGRSRRGERKERHKRRRNGEERHAHRKKHRL